ncbi:unnamed protein product [Schistosoma turkestanicum]|nr:unnamed protein product [Schistosoma turkestanicum]
MCCLALLWKHSELRIEHVITSDSGNYSCRGESKQNQISKWVFVSVYSACPVNVCNVGTCFIINNHSQCRCPETHTGEFCDQSISADKITNKLTMNTPQLLQQKDLNYVQSDSKSSMSIDSQYNSMSILNDNYYNHVNNHNNHNNNNNNNNPMNNQPSQQQNIQLLSEIKRDNFDLCTLPEFQFTSDCLHVKSHLTTFIATAITCSVIILLLTFCAAYFRRKSILNKRKQDCQCLSKENQIESINFIKSPDHRKSPMTIDAENAIYNNSMKHLPSPLKSTSFESKLYTVDSLDRRNSININIDKQHQTNKLNSDQGYNNNSNIQISNNVVDKFTTYNCSTPCSIASSSCSNTAFVVWTTAPELIQQDDSHEVNRHPLGTILIHTNPQQQQQQNSKEQPLPNYFASKEFILNNNNDGLLNVNGVSTLLSSKTAASSSSSPSTVISASNLHPPPPPPPNHHHHPMNVQWTDVNHKIHTLTNNSIQNPLVEVSIHSNYALNKSQQPNETLQPCELCCTNMTECNSMSNSQISTISAIITDDNSLKQFTTSFDTVLQSVQTNPPLLKHIYHHTTDTTHHLPQTSASSSASPSTCIILDQDHLKFQSNLVYFCSNAYPDGTN